MFELPLVWKCVVAAGACIAGLGTLLVKKLARDGVFRNRKDTACIVVGMENSRRYGACPGAKSDSDRMKSLLSKYGEVKLLQDSDGTPTAVTAALVAGCQKPLCVFYYSGHGGQAKNPKADDGTGKSEFLALGTGPLYDYTIWNVVSKAKGRVFMIFDCCHSGTMFRSASAEETAEFSGFRFDLLRRLHSAGSGVNGLFWSGCPANAVSYGSEAGGVFTNAILSSYSSSKTYDEVYAGAVARTEGQNPVKTKLGTGFEGRIFQ